MLRIMCELEMIIIIRQFYSSVCCNCRWRRLAAAAAASSSSVYSLMAKVRV